MVESAMNNISGIEIGSLVIDDANPTNCIMIQTRRNRYCFRLSETFPVEKQYEMFRQFVVDVNTPVETAPAPEEAPTQEGQVKEEKHDGAPLLDVPPSNETPVVEVATQD